MDNSCDKGYLSVLIKGTGDGAELCEIGFTKNPGEKSFWVDYENGKIFIVYDEEQDVIGTYETSPGPFGYNVYDYPSKRLIGRVGEGLISFIRKDVDHAAGRFTPEEECLAYYKNGAIKPKKQHSCKLGADKRKRDRRRRCFCSAFLQLQLQKRVQRLFRHGRCCIQRKI